MSDIKQFNYQLYVVSDNPIYKDLFSLIDEITFVVRLNQAEANVDCQAIFVDGKSIPISDLKELRSVYPNTPIYYQPANIQNQFISKNILTTCAAYGINPIPEELTPQQVKAEIEQELFHKDVLTNRRIASFFGTHSGAGVSTTILNVADLLSKRIEGSVLVLSLNPWDPADYFLPYEGRYLNDLKIDLKTKSLTDDSFMKSLHHYEGSFYHLAGNKDIKLQRFFKIEEIEYLLERARDLFDVVLIDGGPHFDNACYAQAYRGSDLRFLVTTQEPKGFMGYWPHIFSQLLEPIGATSHDFLLVLNRFLPENALATEKDISEQLNMSLLSTIPDEGTLGSSAITHKRLLHSNGATKEYGETLLTIVRAIIGQYNLKEKSEIGQNSNKGFFGRLFQKEKQKV